LKNVHCWVLAAAAAVTAGCATQHKPAPVVDGRIPRQAAPKPLATPVAVTPKSVADYYSVKRGDTLYSIAQEHGVDQRDVMQWNGLDDPTRLRVGQQLRVRPPLAVATAPGVAPVAVVEPQGSAAPQVGSARILGRVESRPLDTLPPLPPRVSAKPELARMEAPARVELEKSGAPNATSQFIWPVKGKVLAEFAEPRRKGIDIDGKPGDPIVASAPGHVTYIGSGIPGREQPCTITEVNLQDVTKDKLIEDLKVVAQDVEELLRATASQTGEKIAAARTRAEETLRSARMRLSETSDDVAESARAAATAADDYVRDNPWQAVGIAAGIGLVVGLVLGRR